jgi:rhodanese-related sulfurtransferase
MTQGSNSSERMIRTELQRLWFRAKLAAEKSKMDVLHLVKEGRGDFVVLDTRDAKSFEKERIPGAVSMPIGEIDRRAPELDPEREYVTYCWNAT